jgi:hypothetical protein
LPCVLIMTVSFSSGDKIPEKINFNEEKFLLAHGFRSLSLWSLGSIVSGPVPIMVGTCDQVKLLNS